MRRLIIAITGATGAIYGVQLLRHLRALGVETHLLLSPAGVLNVHQELDLKRADVEALADVVHSVGDVGAAPGQRIVQDRWHGDRTVLDEDAGRCSPRLRRQSDRTRRRRLFERAPQACLAAARSAIKPCAHSQHGGRNADGRHHFSAIAGVLSAAAKLRTNGRSHAGPCARPVDIEHQLAPRWDGQIGADPQRA